MARALVFLVVAPLLAGAGLIGAARAPSDQLVMFQQRGCPYCAAWNRDVGVSYAKTDEGRKLPLRRVDIADPRPEDLREIRDVVATPTFVIMHCGKEFRRITGYIGQDQFWGLMAIDLKALDDEERAAGGGC